MTLRNEVMQFINSVTGFKDEYAMQLGAVGESPGEHDSCSEHSHHGQTSSTDGHTDEEWTQWLQSGSPDALEFIGALKGKGRGGGKGGGPNGGCHTCSGPHYARDCPLGKGQPQNHWKPKGKSKLEHRRKTR